MLVNIPVSVGELLDKITILEIKQNLLNDHEKLANVNRELELLLSIRDSLELPESVNKLVDQLKHTNNVLWELENAKRQCESQQNFDDFFITVSRDLYKQNDLRGRIKREINHIVGSEIMEEKQYVNY